MYSCPSHTSQFPGQKVSTSQTNLREKLCATSKRNILRRAGCVLADLWDLERGVVARQRDVHEERHPRSVVVLPAACTCSVPTLSSRLSTLPSAGAGALGSPDRGDGLAGPEMPGVERVVPAQSRSFPAFFRRPEVGEAFAGHLEGRGGPRRGLLPFYSFRLVRGNSLERCKIERINHLGQRVGDGPPAVGAG